MILFYTYKNRKVSEANMDYKKYINGPDYGFLRTNPNLGDNICLLTLGGSRAYGTNLPESDVDVRGFAMNKPLTDFEQVVETNTDTTIYSFDKIVKLLLSCNPNTIEIFGCKPEHYLYLNEVGQELLSHANDFLSVKVITSFGGYANAQYNRLEHGLLGNGENDDKKLLMLKHSLESAMQAFNTMHKDISCDLDIRLASTDEVKFLYPKRKIVEDTSNDHILVSGNFNSLPVTDFKEMISFLHKIQSEYGQINKRNTKKTDVKLAKHMMHLVRLFLMGTDLNKGNGIITYRTKEHNMLMDIRLGKYMTGNGMQVRPEFYDLLKEIQKEYEYSVKHTVLPETPNIDSINEMVIDMHYRMKNMKQMENEYSDYERNNE